MKLLAGVMLLVSVVFMAMEQSSQADAGLDVNDVSILFPLKGKTQLDPLPDLHLDTPTESGDPIMERQTYEDVAGFAKKVDDDGLGLFEKDEFPNWRIASFRYDPCAPSSSQVASTCIQQVRLIALFPLPTYFSPPNVQDGAIHLIYQVGEGPPRKGDRMLADLLEIKRATESRGDRTTDVPLAIHPGLSADLATDSTFVSDLVRRFVLRYVASRKLVEIAATTGNNWVFFQGVVANGRWKVAPIFNIKGFKEVFSGQMEVTPEPGRLAPSTAAYFTNSAYPRPVNFSELHRIMNPQLTHPKNMDCVSCHTASDIVTKLPAVGIANVFRNPVGITGFVEWEMNHTGGNLRNFGYTSDEPHVSFLTANASAYVADLANRTQGWTNPSSRDCSDARVRECFGTIGGTASKCLKLCKPKR